MRAFNYENIYLRPSSHAQGDLVIKVLRGLVDHYTDRPNLIPSVRDVLAGSEQASGKQLPMSAA